MNDVTSGAAVPLREVTPPQSPTTLTASHMQSGPLLTPRKIIQTYDADEWEIFIEEWATSLQPRFTTVRRFGGSGDKGVDVAAFRTERGFEDEWECFQGKYYASSLTPATAWPEILKIFSLTLEYTEYKLPVKYYFIAPKGMGTRLGHLLASPTRLKDAFLKQLSDGNSQTFNSINDDKRSKIETVANDVDFSMFSAVEVRDLIEQHSKTPYFPARFGGGLPPRPAPQPAPEEVHNTELVYITKLIDAYKEKYKELEGTLPEVTTHRKTSQHFQRQREAFFRAESLKRFARDSVPVNTYEHLQQEVFDAVIETVEADHENGLERLRRTLDQAVTAQLTANALINVTEAADRKGICHQLSNENRLSWISES